MDKQKRKKTYSKAELITAIESINNGMSIYEASKKFNIPKTTLRDKRDGKYKNESCGIQPILHLNEEKMLVDWIHYLGKSGFPITKEQLLESVAKLVLNLNRPNPFKNGVPGIYWFENFIKRHPTVSKRVAQNLHTSRNNVTEASIRAWFDRVNNYFLTNGLLHVFQDPRRIFNCDETAFFLCPKEKQVLVRRGSKRVYNRVSNDEKECWTVLVNVSADGNIAPPMILFPYKRLPKNLVPTLPRGWGLGNTESGWMNTEAFFEYVTNCFYPWLVSNEIILPVVLFLDGHTSHISLPLSTFCKENGIILVALLPNSTHILQPLDVAVFRPVKGTWRGVVHEFRVKNNFAKLKRTDFAPQVKRCFDQCLKSEIIKSGFQCCGLYPFEPTNINYSKLLSKVKNTNEDIQANTLTNTHVDIEKFKKHFEDRLTPATLQKFKTSGDQWTGDVIYEKLFQYWKRIIPEDADNQDNEHVLQLGEVTLNNNFVDETPDISEVILNFDVTSDDNLIPIALEQETVELGEGTSNLFLLTDKSFCSPTVNEKLLKEQEEKNQPLQTSTPQQNHIFQLGVPETDDLHNQFIEPMSDLPISPPSKDIVNETEVKRHEENTPAKMTNRAKEHLTSLKVTEVLPHTSTTLPTPFKNITTPFKNALYFPKIKMGDTKKTKNKKVTPTVAIADEFMEYQERLEKEKEEKENKKQKRKLDILEKKEQKELLRQKMKLDTLIKKKTSENKQKPVKKANTPLHYNKSPTLPILEKAKERPESSSMVVNKDFRKAATSTYQPDCATDYSTYAREAVKRRCFYSSESEDESIF